MTSRTFSRRGRQGVLPFVSLLSLLFCCLFLAPLIAPGVRAAAAPGAVNIGTDDDPYFVDSLTLQQMRTSAPEAGTMASALQIFRVGNWTTGLSHTVGAGTNRLLVFSVGYEHNSDPGVSAVTYGGQSLTRIDGAVIGSSVRNRTELWYLDEAGIAAASGSTFSVTWGGSTPGEAKYGAATYANVNQTTPINDNSFNTDNNGSPSTITTDVNVVAGGMVVSSIINGNSGTFTWNNGYVSGFNQGSGTSTLSAADHQEFSAGTSTASATHNNAGRRVIVAASLMPADATATLDDINISQIDPSQFPNICVYVEALDQGGNPYHGLDADSFCVFQDSIQIGYFTVEQLTVDSCRTATCLVIDVSGSMQGANITAAKAAASRFVRNMDVFDRAAIVTFGACYTVVQNFTGDTTVLLNAIAGLTTGGRTAYFDGVYRGVELTVPELGSKAVVNLTDGLENNSGSCAGGPDGLGDGFADDSTLIVNLALGAGIPIYSITLGSGFDPQYAQKLAFATGGSYFHAPLPGDLDAIYDEIKERLCTRYKICYASPDTVQNGDCHDVVVCYEESPGNCVECDTAVYCEVAPPKIVRTPATIALDNTCQRWDNAVQLCAYVTDDDTPLNQLTVTLFYRNNNVSPYTSIATTRTDSTFCAWVPASALECGKDSIQYYFTASDGSVTVASPSSAPMGHHAFPICPNSPPVCHVPEDTTIALCSAVQVCLPVFGTDPDGNLESCTKLSGPGTLSGGQWCYTPSGNETVQVTVECVDSCGLACQETFEVTFQTNTPPVCSVPNDTTIFQCAPAQVCLPVAGLDGDGNLTGCVIMSGPGTLSGGNWCYTPSGDEVATVTIRCTDACGAYCEETFEVTFVINEAPVCDPINDTTVYLCAPAAFCLPVGANDADGNLTGCSVQSGPGTVSGGQWCYTPSGSETVNVTIRCEDACGAYCDESFSVTFVVNAPPEIVLDTIPPTPMNFNGDSVCVTYSVSDPDGLTGLIEELVSGPSGTTIDTAANTVCFVPPGAGNYDIIVKVTDPCGESDYDTVTVSIFNPQPPLCFLPGDTSVILCSPSALCLPVLSTSLYPPVVCSVTSGPGTVSGGQWCYTAGSDTAFSVTITCTDSLGSTCSETFNVTIDINDAPVCSVPNDTTIFQCSAAQICLPVSATDANGNLTGCTIESGPGTLSGGNWCYTPTGNETVFVTIRCTDACGAYCEETFSVTFEINEAPVCSVPNDTTIFQCAAAQVCLPVSATDADGNLTGCTIESGPGTLSGGNWCYTPTGSETVNVTIRCTDACGAFCEETFSVTFEINEAPVCSVPNDTTIFQCAAAQVCLPVSATDADGNLTGCTIESSPGSLSGGNWCYTPSGSGTVNVTIRCTDACGAFCEETFSVTFEINEAPVCSVPNDTTIFQCTAAQVCLPVSATDADGNLTGCTIESGPGTLSGGNWCYTPTGDETVNVTIRCTDACGAYCEESFSVTFEINEAPVCASIADTTYEQCTPTQVCRPVSATDADGNLVNCVVVSGPGSVSGGNWCYTPTDDEVINVTIRCTDACGAYCEESFTVTFEINDPPTITLGNDFSIYQSFPANEICVTYTVNDPDGPAGLIEEVISAPSGYSFDSLANKVCFTPPDTGWYTIIVKVTDPCGEMDQDTINIHVVPSPPPVCSVPNDTTIFQCTAAQICLPVSASGSHGPITCSVLSGPGSVSGGNWCYTPVSSGVIAVTIRCTDTLGVSCDASFNVTVELNVSPVCSVPNDTTIFQCPAAQVCLPVSATDANGNLTGCTIESGPGTLSGGNWCYTPSGSETVNVTIRCTDDCGAYCEETFSVTFEINEAPVCSVPNDTTIFQCAAAQVCLPVSATDADGNLTGCTIESGPGTLSGGNWCYTPTGSETVNVTIRCTDACGAFCEETFSVTFEINEAPVCSVPNDTTIFQCAAAQVCLPVSATDADGNLTGCTIESGPGSLSGGNWCYTPSGSGTVNVTIRCTDACGAFCEETFSVTFVINEAPVCSVPNDTTIFQCAAAQVCLPVSATDADGNLTGCTIESGPGSLSGGNWCYTPSGNETVNVTIRCTDACGAYCEETFSVTFQIGQPIDISCRPDTSVSCLAQVPPCDPGDATVTGGAGTVNVTCSSSNNGGSGCASDPLIITYTYEATDSCGATDQCQRTITVIDDEAPILNGCPGNFAIGCGAPIPDTANVTATDNCDGGVPVDFLEVIDYSGCGGYTGTITRRWIATDNCGNADTCFQVIMIEDTEDPVCSIPAGPFTFFQCVPAQVTIPVSATDNCDQSVSCQVVSGPGAIVGSSWQYNPTGPGSFTVVVRCTDACGNYCEDSFDVQILGNSSPTISLGPDQQVSPCTPSQICVNYTVSDTDGLGGAIEELVSSPPGAIIDTLLNQICFTPVASGSFTIIARITDSCGSIAVDTVVVNVTVNSPPTIAFGDDFTVFQCSPTQICVPYAVVDPNGPAGLVETLISGPPGTAINAALDLVCFTPVAGGSYTIIARVTDPCGASDQDTIVVTVNMNQAPTCQVPNDTSIFQCSPAQVCLPVSGSDPDGGNVTITKVNGPGTVSGGNWCYTPTGDQTVNVTIRVTDSCGAFTDRSFSVTFDVNTPPVCQVPANTTIRQACEPQQVLLPVSATDADGHPVTCQIVSGPGVLQGGNWVYTPSGSGQVCVTIACTDSCGATCQKTFCIYFDIETQNCDCELIVSVGDDDGYMQVLNGARATISVNFDSLSSPIGGFDLLICYDASALVFVSAARSSLMSSNGWEYFTYRNSAFGNCTGNCPSGYVRLVGIANMDNGVTPPPGAFLPIGPIADLTFQVTSDRNFINQCIPVSFCWFDCGDNTVASKLGDTTWVEHTMIVDTCTSNGKVNPIPGICFSTGYICIVEPPDDRGDINMNGIANEVGDAVLFSNFFIYGPVVWLDPPADQSQILATDVNDDGIVLTVADLVYLIRIITGDAQPFPPGTGTGHPKLAPYAESGEVTVRTENGRAVLSAHTTADLGAVWAVLRYTGLTPGQPELLDAAAGLTLSHRAGSGELRILVRPQWEGNLAGVPSGINDLVAIPFDGDGRMELVDVQLSDRNGAVMAAVIAKGAVLPTEFALLQNYPNPFNAGTVISFTLAEESDWTLTIYNVAGQTVRSYEGHDAASVVSVHWDGMTSDGGSVPSGVYLYRVKAGSHSASKKMILLR